MRLRREARACKRWDEYPDDPENCDRQRRAMEEMCQFDRRDPVARKARANSRFDLDPFDDRYYSGQFGPPASRGI
jgi:hypothetical protein